MTEAEKRETSAEEEPQQKEAHGDAMPAEWPPAAPEKSTDNLPFGVSYQSEPRSNLVGTLMKGMRRAGRQVMKTISEVVTTTPARATADKQTAFSLVMAAESSLSSNAEGRWYQFQADVPQTQRHDVEALLKNIEAHTRGGNIVRALRALNKHLGQVLKIHIFDTITPNLNRPTLDNRQPGNVWHLCLPALQNEPLDTAINELAAVYNNMTGILDDQDPFMGLRACGQPQVDSQLQIAWRKWIEKPSVKPDDIAPENNTTHKPLEKPTGAPQQPSKEQEHRAMLVQNQLYPQEQEKQCYGGKPRSYIKQCLYPPRQPEAAIQDEGIKVSVEISLDPLLSGKHLQISSVPPLAQDTESLQLSQFTITDWSRLPTHLKYLSILNSDIYCWPASWPADMKAVKLVKCQIGKPLILPPGVATNFEA